MKFFFDESGSFELPPQPFHKAAVCAGLIVPDPVFSRLEANYSAWRDTLADREKEKGEPKGRLLDPASRLRFFQYVGGVPYIVTVPTIVDLEFQRQVSKPDDLSAYLKHGALRAAAQIRDPIARKKQEKAAGQMGRLRPSQLYRLRAMADCIEYALRDALDWYSSSVWADCWQHISITVDQPDPDPRHPEADFMRSGLLPLLSRVAARRPLIPSLKINGTDHPITPFYARSGELDLARILEDFRFADSRDEIGLQSVDILAHSLYLGVNDLANEKGNLEWYSCFMQRSKVDPESDLGITFSGDGVSGPIPDASKYEVLRQILRKELHLRF